MDDETLQCDNCKATCDSDTPEDLFIFTDYEQSQTGYDRTRVWIQEHWTTTCKNCGTVENHSGGWVHDPRDDDDYYDPSEYDEYDE